MHILTHHNAISHEEHHPTKDVDHEERHWQSTQVIILTTAKEIPVTCFRAQHHK